MNEITRFTSRVAVALAFATLAGASAFADSRHPKTTEGQDEARAAVVARDRSGLPVPAATSKPSSRSRANVEPAERPSVAPKGRAEAAERPATNDRSGRSRDGREFEDREGAAERERSYELSNSSTRGRGREQRDRYEHDGGDRGKRAPHYAQGKVAKVKPYNNGYRVWIHGSSHPYYVPQAYWRPGYFNVGMTVRVGGYYNPSGWYDYYGDYECNTISEQRMRGIVEDVDYRRGELLLDMVGGGYVTIDVSHRREPVRPGDYVVVYGNWNRWGRFVALDVDIIDRAYRW